MKKNITILLLLFISITAFANTVVNNYRWRNDDGNQTTASWKANVNTPITIKDENLIRLRFSVQEIGSGSDFKIPDLEYKKTTESTWTVIDNTTNNDFVFSASNNVNNGDVTSQQISNKPDFFSSDYSTIISSKSAGSLRIGKNQAYEIEFVFKTTNNVSLGATYEFRPINHTTYDETAQATTAQIFQPFFESTPTFTNITESSFTLNTDLNEAGTIYYVILPDGATAPTSAEVKAGTGNSGATAITSGSEVTNNATFTNTINFTSLIPGANYDIYVVAEDATVDLVLQDNPLKLDARTIDTTPPVFENSTPSISNIQQTEFSLSFDIDEAGRVHYVLVADGATVPTISEIKAGTASAGATPVKSGNATITTAPFTDNFSISGLTGATAYDLYIVAEDDESTPNTQTTIIKFDVATSGLQQWYKANDGLTKNASNEVTAWVDQSTFATTSTPEGAPIQANSINFNPAVTFDGTGNQFFRIDLSGIDNNNYNFIAVSKRTSSKSANNLLGTGGPAANRGLHFGYNGNQVLQLAHFANDLNVPISNGFNAPEITPVILRGSLDTTVGRAISELKAGNLVQGSDNNTATLTGFTSSFLGIGFNTTRAFQGDIAEVIVYNSTLTNAELDKIYSYLAIKYGLTLDNSDGGTAGDYVASDGATIFWDASENATYYNDITVIAKDSGNDLEQPKSKSENGDAIVTIEKTGAIADMNAIAVGNNDIVHAFSATNSPTALQTSNRVWKMQKTGALTDISISLEISGNSDVLADYQLLVSTDADFTTGTTNYAASAINGDTITFNNIATANNVYFTIAQKSFDIVSLLPANNDVNVNFNGDLEITFSDNVTKGTGFITIHNADFSSFNTLEFIDVLGDNVVVENEKVTITPRLVLQNGGNYYINIPSTAFKDSTDKNFVGITDNTTWSFGLEGFTRNNIGYRVTSATAPLTAEAVAFFNFNTNLVIPETTTDNNNNTYAVTGVGANAFEDSAIVSVTLPASITALGNEAFKNAAVTSVRSNSTTPATLNAGVFNKSEIDLIIPFGTTAAYVAAGWTGFKSVTELDFVVDNILYKITSSTAPLTVEAINYAGQSGGLTIPETVTNSGNTYTVTSIGSGAFKAKFLSNAVTIPNTIVTIKAEAFKDNNIRDFRISSGNNFGEDDDDGPGQMGTEPVVPALESIGNGAFQNNSLRNTLFIPKKVNSIGDFAFANNTFTFLDISSENEVTIGSNAFDSNSNLRSVFSRTNTPAILPANAITNRSNIRLFIPAATTNTYTTANWTGFSEIEEQRITINDISYRVTSSTAPLTVETQDYTGTNTTVVIPSSVTILGNTYAVTGIGRSTFLSNSLTSVTIPNTVVNIEESAFRNNQLTSITLPPNLTKIGMSAFVNNQLTTINIPNTVSVLENSAFASNELVSANLPTNLTTIPSGLFANNKLTSITIPNTVTTIESVAFRDNLLTNITIPNGLLRIEDDAFQRNKLTLVNLPNSITFLGNRVFRENLITSANIPNTLTEIKSSLFEENLLTAITIPASVTRIERSAFEKNKIANLILPSTLRELEENVFRQNLLTSITIPNTITSLDDDIFSENPITKVTSEFINPIRFNDALGLNARDAVLIVPKGTTADHISQRWNRFRTILEPEIIDEDFIFETIEGATPLAVKLIGYTGTSKTPVIPESTVLNGDTYAVTTIAESAFEDLELAGVTIPDSVTSIESDAFLENKITNLILPNSVVTIGSEAFAENEIATISFSTAMTTIGNNVFSNNKLTALTIPSTIIAIGSSAFSSNEINSLTLPNTLVSIGQTAFSSNKLTSVIIPSSVTTLGTYAFSNNLLTNVTMLNSVTTIPEGLFESNELANFTFPSTVNTIGGRAFRDNKFVNLTLPEGIQTLDSEAFRDNQIVELNLPNTLVNIGFRSFYFNEIEELIVPNSVTTISDESFRFNNLSNITLPSSVTSLGRRSFDDNTTLQNITSTSTSPTNLNSAIGVFARTNVTLLVPSGTTAAYNTAGWTDFKSIIEPDIISNGIVYKITSSIAPLTVEAVAYLGRDTTIILPASITDNGNVYAVTSIGEKAFFLKNLDSLTLPNTITTIGDSAFANNNLTTLDLPTTLISIGDFAFNNNNITSIDFPNSVTSIGISAFQSNALNSVTLPNNLALINERSFSRNQLEEITLPSSVTNIQNQAFASNRINTIFADATTPPVLNTLAFLSNSITDVIVPQASLTDYRADVEWGKFFVQVNSVLTFNDITKEYRDADFILNASTTSTGAISYSIVSGGTGSATLSGINNNTVTLGNAGTVIIRATSAVDGDFAEISEDITLTITPKAIAIVAEAKTKVYGESDPALTFSINPALETGDVLTGSLSRAMGEDVGTYPISSTLANANYTITFTGADFTITSKAIAIAAEAKTKVYGESDPALTFSINPALETGDVLTGSLS
ncbi:leucine-rich repeat protein, partial [uncultured Polaribacter sp.]|uniref:leucine-rich repeat protein n=1 Tax=uncultured Polaribacter sp. TaxID=174711 RepID=UPI00260AE790